MKLNRFAIAAWAAVAYNILVILWGAYVRASGSGAGCGNHWPLCNGAVIPTPENIKTLVEFSHRLTSGLDGVLLLGLALWAFWRYPGGRRMRFGVLLELAVSVFWRYPGGHRVRSGAVYALRFVLIEGLIGRALVRNGLVAEDDSAARAIVIALHLANTFLLLGALTLTAWWASGGRALRLRGQGGTGWLLGVALAGVVLVGMSGAVTALGDTLFPSDSLRAGLAQDLSPTAHFLIRLRVLHPILAVVVGLYSAATALGVGALRPSGSIKRLAQALTALVVAQLLVGSLNVALLAPIGMQIVHLLLADLVWIVLLVVAATGLAQPETEAAVLTETAVFSAAPEAKA